jgi:hypothetical protein
MKEERSYRIGRVAEVGRHCVKAVLEDSLRLPPPPFGSLVKIDTGTFWIYGLVSDASRRQVKPTMLGRLFTRIERSAPSTVEESTIDLQILVVGYREQQHRVIPVQGLPTEKPSRGDAVCMPDEEEIQLFALDLEYVKLLLGLPGDLPVDQLLIASLKRFSSVYPDPHSYMVRAGHELTRLLRNDHQRVSSILKYVTHGDQPFGMNERTSR